MVKFRCWKTQLPFQTNRLTPAIIAAILISSFDEITIYARIHGRHQGAVRPQPRADSPGAPAPGTVRLPDHGTVRLRPVHYVQTPFHSPSRRPDSVPQDGTLGLLPAARQGNPGRRPQSDGLGAEVGRRHAGGRAGP